jgi:hypothetical protein
MVAFELADCQGGGIRGAARVAVCRREVCGGSKGGGAGFRVGFHRGALHKQSGRWEAMIGHDRIEHRLGRFDNDEEAARAYDTAARRLRSQGKAHGGRSGTHWQRLNFPTAKEVAYAAWQGLLYD